MIRVGFEWVGTRPQFLLEPRVLMGIALIEWSIVIILNVRPTGMKNEPPISVRESGFPYSPRLEPKLQSNHCHALLDNPCQFWNCQSRANAHKDVRVSLEFRVYSAKMTRWL